MKNLNATLLLALTWFILASPGQAQEQSIDLRPVSTLSQDTVILDLIADTDGIALRSFGLTVGFEPGQLELDSAGRYQEIWFLSRESGERLPYTDTRLADEGKVSIIGGRLSAAQPAEGVSGSQVLLATLVFKRLDNTEPRFTFDFAGTPPFANFVQAGGDSVDDMLALENVEVIEQTASEDLDDDGLPDGFEIDTFGDLQTSDGSTDRDGDGDSDYDEWVKGTDPNDPDSKQALTVQVLADGSKLLQWDGQPNRVYEIERASSLETFEVLAAGLPGEDGSSERLDESTDNAPSGFYRLKVRFPTAR